VEKGLDPRSPAIAGPSQKPDSGSLKDRAEPRKNERMVEGTERPKQSRALRLATIALAATSLGVGIFGISFGSIWAPAALELVASSELAQKFELALPFVPISLIAMGAFLAVRSRR
jgi:hypothetical protein